MVLVLTLMQGLVGMALGLLISAVCDEEIAAIQASLGSVYPNMLLSGKNLTNFWFFMFNGLFKN